MARYDIFEGNMERLEKKLTRIANKCEKYGCSFHYSKVGETFRTMEDENGIPYTAKFIVIEAEGTAIVNDWEFVASIEHTEKGNIIDRIGDIEVPERYYQGKPICEHCKSNRYRKYTYIVRNTVTNQFMQVGKSCLQDFTNGMSAEGIAHYISLFDTLIEGEAPYPGCYGERYLNTKTALKFVAETIKHFGYVRTQDSGRSTASRAFGYYEVSHGYIWNREVMLQLKSEMDSVGFNEESLDTVQLVHDALNWILQQEETNNYMHNLKTACSLEYVTYKNSGILASLFPTYNRELEYQAEKAERERRIAAERANEQKSIFIGKVKDRITIKVYSVKCVTSWETDFGITRIYKIVDVEGNVYTWKTGNFLEDKIDTLVGTVKDHKEYRGIKQTEITRCRVVA